MNPLAELDAWWEAAYDDGGCCTYGHEFAQQGPTCRLTFTTADDQNALARWQIDADGVGQLLWTGPGGDPEWFDDHILLASPTWGPWISFSSPFADPGAALLAVLRAHRKIAGRWIPLTRYFRVELLDERFGELARGPEELVTAYQDALQALGCDVAIGYHQPRETTEPPRSLITIDRSYIIAESFKLRRLE